MKYIFILLISIVLISCQYKKTTASFHKLHITYSNGWGKRFSVIIDSTGKVILGRKWADRTFFNAQLDDQDLLKLDSAYRRTPFESYDSTYSKDDRSDLYSYKVVLPDFDNKAVYVYGGIAPESLKSFIGCVREIVEKLFLTPADTAVIFESHKGFYPVQPPLK
ncbi:hypothetical protein HHL17_16145 [Chitinophaga sp. G-6-1-13]|uniref:Lipoprotein n=1 Tax=Chitinophaga fulva TaxID=2728842 RepID=A0A848GMA0_9BACT|nr:hypothetical protein [Chitinophaga fulva]NML38741.1 hypothetical protein [Chitinophaga fulva]